MNRYERPVTPAEISTALQGLIDELVPGGLTTYVDVVPAIDTQANECFHLVEQRIKIEGGSALFGWSLWELPTLFVEAEFHCVWLRPSGELLDVAPKNHETTKVLFLPDPTRRYEGRQVNNVRKAVRNDPLLVTYLETFSAEFDILNKGERAWQHEVVLSAEEAIARKEILQTREECHFQLLDAFPIIGPYHPCPCGSGKKVRWCHKRIGAA